MCVCVCSKAEGSFLYLCVLHLCDFAHLSVYSLDSVCVFKNLRKVCVCVCLYDSVWVPLFTEECLSASGVINPLFFPTPGPLLLLFSLFTLDSLLLHGIKQ